MNIVLVRQRPALGDALLLAPLVREVKRRHPDAHLTVMTDKGYRDGVLLTTFAGVPGVDEVVHYPPTGWTTISNKLVEPSLFGASDVDPEVIVKADIVLDCNGQFVQYERDHDGNAPMGIAEFWVREHGFWSPGVDLRPSFVYPQYEDAAVDHWLKERNKPILGIVLNAGERARHWNYDRRVEDVVIWAGTSGYYPVTIDARNGVDAPHGQACINKDIPFVAALLKRCKAVLTPDTGMLHLAEAVGTPTISLWGTVDPAKRTGGYRTRIVPEKPYPRCDRPQCACCAWQEQFYSCLRSIRLNEIVTACSEVLTHECELYRPPEVPRSAMRRRD